MSKYKLDNFNRASPDDWTAPELDEALSAKATFLVLKIMMAAILVGLGLLGAYLIGLNHVFFIILGVAGIVLFAIILNGFVEGICWLIEWFGDKRSVLDRAKRNGVRDI